MFDMQRNVAATPERRDCGLAARLVFLRILRPMGLYRRLPFWWRLPLAHKPHLHHASADYFDAPAGSRLARSKLAVACRYSPRRVASSNPLVLPGHPAFAPPPSYQPLRRQVAYPAARRRWFPPKVLPPIPECTMPASGPRESEASQLE